MVGHLSVKTWSTSGSWIQVRSTCACMRVRRAIDVCCTYRYTTKWYKHIVRAFLPAGLANKPKVSTCASYAHTCTQQRNACVVQDAKFFTLHEVVSARQQSADRYTCEALFSRVKQFRVLTGRRPLRNCQYMNSAWYVAHMAANMYKPLAVPDTMHQWSGIRDASAALGGLGS